MASAFLQPLLTNLSSLIQGEIGLIMGADQEMKKLSSNLTTIQAVLEDAEQKQFASKPIQDWLCKLTDLTYEIDDIVDECAMEVSKSEHENCLTSRCGLKKFLFRHKIGRRIKEVAGKVDMIAAEREKFHLRELGTERRSNHVATRERETGSVINETQVHVYGRNEEKDRIVDIMVNQVKDCEQLSVLPIEGIGGLGKTTLARMVFNDKEVIGHFDVKIWACVSDNFDLKTVIKAMIESATKSACDLTSLDALQCRLRELLNQKRYLLVLDDVWDNIESKWDDLRNVITCGSRGAVVVLTTRLKRVAEITGTLPAHSIGELSEEDCWLLLKEQAFGQKKDEYPSLESIGKQIVKKCGGVPLAAKALGGLLRFERTQREWIHVKDSEIWKLPAIAKETSLLQSLRLSYLHLPSELRRCFAYCAVFPKDSEIEKETLIFHWMAHGYISPSENREEEDIGDDIWKKLVWRSLFQDEETNYEGKTFTTMHDLVHYLARSILTDEGPETQAPFNSICKIRQVNLRTRHVVFPSSLRDEIDLSFSLMNLSSLRNLDASETIIDNIPSKISNLKHLRYLNLSSTQIRIVPSGICSLWNLKILNLNKCYKLVELPKHMRFLKNLRHLLLEECFSLSEMPPKIGELRSLKTLSLFIVGPGQGRKLVELQFLNLGGKLSICHLERVENLMDANMANLRGKENLCELILEWESKNRSKLSENMEENVLEALEPHPNLQILRISGFHGQNFPRWLSNPSLLNLVECVLNDCPNCSSLPHLSKLPHLKILYVRNLVVEYIVEDEVEDGSPVVIKFPLLEVLELEHLYSLKGFGKGEATVIFPRLHSLKIWECSRLILEDIKEMKSLTKLELYHLQELVSLSKAVKHLPSICSLTLWGLPQLTELAECLTSLTSLRHLFVHNCPMLTSLPHGIKEMKNLESLSIHVCPELERRCERERGEDWHKIAHIPTVRIG